MKRKNVMKFKSKNKQRKTADKKLISSIFFETELKTDKKLMLTFSYEIELNIIKFLTENKTNTKRFFS